MNEIDVIGFIGVSLILIAYFLNLNMRLHVNDIKYILLNLIGALLACLASVLMAYYPFVLLEGTWAIVSLVALFKYLRPKVKVGEIDLDKMIINMKPVLNEGEYVFTSIVDTESIPRNITVCELKETEGVTVIVSRKDAETLGLSFEYVASWITLNIHSALEAVGLTAAFSTELAKNNISCNVMAGYYHDHIFVDKKDGQKALRILQAMSNKGKIKI